MKPTIYFATDHAGFAQKEILVSFVRDVLGYIVVDCGAYTFDQGDDFTDYIAKASREVSQNRDTARAIILGGSGQGEAMLANRFVGVRAVVYYGGPTDILTLSREHNDANVLSLGARFISIEEAKKAVMLWLSVPHEKKEKYDRRIEETETFSQIGVSPQHCVVAPSYPAPSFRALEHMLTSLKGIVKQVQVDIVDGQFASATSWPFTEEHSRDAFLKLKGLSGDFEIEVDMMCMEPEVFIPICAEVGVQRVIVHLGSTEKLSECIALARAHHMRIGLACTSSTQRAQLRSLIEQFDFVQVMGIKRIGSQGQPFDEGALEMIAYIRSLHPSLEIAVDGAVNQHTIERLKRAGANRFAPGSAIVGADDPALAYKQLSALIGAK